jgi:hypothetical protein
MRCVYRTESGSQEVEASFPFKFLGDIKCADCQILKAQNAKDSTCHNLDLTEKTCAISPQSEVKATK